MQWSASASLYILITYICMITVTDKTGNKITIFLELINHFYHDCSFCLLFRYWNSLVNGLKIGLQILLRTVIRAVSLSYFQVWHY